MMTISMMMRGGVVAVALATAALIQGCTMPQSNASSGVYNNDYAAALDSAMTTDQGGE